MTNTHRADIDGLRALAVLPVIFFHYDLGFPGGFTGVDVFFVISGFLISRIILSELDKSSFSILNFYKRRVLRILPALLVVTLASTFAGLFLLMPGELKEFGKQLLVSVLCISNVYFMMLKDDYWTGNSEYSPLLHTWSLSVEEQFYLIIPILFLVIHRRCKNRLPALIGILAIVSFLLSVHTTETSPKFSFYSTQSRAWELLLGSTVHLYSRGKSPKLNSAFTDLISLLGLLSILYGFFALNSESIFPGTGALYTSLGTAAVVYCGAHHSTWTSRLLSLPALRFLGTISYSLYLWHWPLLVFCKFAISSNEDNLISKMALLAVSIGMATITWNYVELPFRKISRTSNPYRVLCTGGIAISVMAMIGVFLIRSEGLPSRLTVIADQSVLSDFERHRSIGMRSEMEKFNARQSFTNGGKKIILHDGPIDLVVIGDSHACALAPEIAEAAQKNDLNVTFFTAYGLRSVLESADGDRETVNRAIKQWNFPAVLVILRLDHRLATYEQNPEIVDNFKSELTWLCKNSSKCGILIQVPSLHKGQFGDDFESRFLRVNQNALRQDREDGIFDGYKEIPESSQSARTNILRLLEGLEIPALDIIDPYDVFVSGEQIRYRRGNSFFYFDNDHITRTGAIELIPLVVRWLDIPELN